MKQNEQQSRPFFAQFLENQQREERAANTATKPWLDQVETHKYPSDSDEGIEA